MGSSVVFIIRGPALCQHYRHGFGIGLVNQLRRQRCRRPHPYDFADPLSLIGDANALSTALRTVS
jgi:hypothetical protein